MRASVVALVLSAVALGTAGIALRQEPAAPPRSTRAPTEGRIAALEAQVADLAREVDRMRTAPDARARPATPTSPEVAPAEDGGGEPFPAVAADDPVLEKVVDAAVDRKTKQVIDELRVKANKKPEIGVFAAALELTDKQRAVAERVVSEGQRQVYGILETPTQDGTNLMDELVEIVARGMAEPGKDHGFGQWFARVVGEKIPGTDATYGARIEAVKNRMRAAFKRDWSEEQYQEFAEWGVDPTEIGDIPGSPRELLIKRVRDRARALGAELPEDD